MAEWQTVQWGDLTALEYGKALRDYRDSKGQYRVFGTNGPIGWHDEAVCQHPTVIIGRKGAYRGIHYSQEPCAVIDTAFYLKPRSDFDMKWAYYELLTHDINGLDSGSAIPSTTRDAFYHLPVKVPPLSTQRAIAHILGSLDDLIDLNRRTNETLEQIARTFFNHYFPYSPDDDLPEGWSVGTLREVVGFLPGFAFKSKDWQDLGVPVVKIGSVKPGVVDLGQVSFVSEEVAKEASHFRLKAGDLLIGMTGYVGEVGLVPPTDNPPLLNQRVGKFIFDKEGTEGLGYVYCLTRNNGFKSAVEVRSHGTAQANVSADGILSVPIAVPPREIRDEFNRLCKPLLDTILGNMGSIRTLAVLRDLLLPKLLSGVVRVEELTK